MYNPPAILFTQVIFPNTSHCHLCYFHSDQFCSGIILYLLAAGVLGLKLKAIGAGETAARFAVVSETQGDPHS